MPYLYFLYMLANYPYFNVTLCILLTVITVSILNTLSALNNTYYYLGYLLYYFISA